MKVKCDCEDWQTGMSQIASAQTLAWTHGQRYTGVVFRYCPWCGKKLEEDKDAKSDV